MENEISMETMTAEYVDVLRELGNIGAGNAMTALSQMLNCKVDRSEEHTSELQSQR